MLHYIHSAHGPFGFSILIYYLPVWLIPKKVKTEETKWWIEFSK